MGKAAQIAATPPTVFPVRQTASGFENEFVLPADSRGGRPVPRGQRIRF